MNPAAAADILLIMLSSSNLGNGYNHPRLCVVVFMDTAVHQLCVVIVSFSLLLIDFLISYVSLILIPYL